MKLKTFKEKLGTIVKGVRNVDKVIDLLEEAGIDVKGICESKKVVMPRQLSAVQVQAMCDVIRHYSNSKPERRRIAYEAAVHFRDKKSVSVRDFMKFVTDSEAKAKKQETEKSALRAAA